MDDAVQALMMAFSVIVFVIAFALALYMFSQVTATSEVISQYADTTRFYDNIKISSDDEITKNGTVRIVDRETVIPTLYRYYKENFCVKIYDATGTVESSTVESPKLLQIFDVNLEGEVNAAAGDTKATDGDILQTTVTAEQIKHNALNKIYNNFIDSDRVWNNRAVEGRIYMFGAPWIGSTENMKTRIDYFINASAGYINNEYVDYTGNFFAEAIKDSDNKYKITEEFISYSYSGSKFETEDGDVLVTGEKSKDKIVIIYTIIKNEDII